jgi:DNA modification methylase
MLEINKVIQGDCLEVMKDINNGKYDLNLPGVKCSFSGLEETEEAAKAWAERVRINMDRENKKENKKWYQFWIN